MQRRNISHFTFARTINHLNYRLAGSIPAAVIRTAREQREQELARATSDAPPEIFSQAVHRIYANYELTIDHYLDSATHGPLHLQHPQLANIVLDALRNYHQRNKIHLYVACVMSNHVHIVVGPAEHEESLHLAEFMRLHKGYTAYECNKVIGKTGQAFWEKNYFDRVVRRGKFSTVMWYVLNNPVKAGLVTTWRDWPGTWLNPDYDELF